MMVWLRPEAFASDPGFNPDVPLKFAGYSADLGLNGCMIAVQNTSQANDGGSYDSTFDDLVAQQMTVSFWAKFDANTSVGSWQPYISKRGEEGGLAGSHRRRPARLLPFLPCAGPRPLATNLTVRRWLPMATGIIWSRPGTGSPGSANCTLMDNSAALSQTILVLTHLIGTPILFWAASGVSRMAPVDRLVASFLASCLMCGNVYAGSAERQPGAKSLHG